MLRTLENKLTSKSRHGVRLGCICCPGIRETRRDIHPVGPLSRRLKLDNSMVEPSRVNRILMKNRAKHFRIKYVNTFRSRTKMRSVEPIFPKRPCFFKPSLPILIHLRTPRQCVLHSETQARHNRSGWIDRCPLHKEWGCVLRAAWRVQEAGGMWVKPFVAMMDAKAIMEL